MVPGAVSPNRSDSVQVRISRGDSEGSESEKSSHLKRQPGVKSSFHGILVKKGVLLGRHMTYTGVETAMPRCLRVLKASHRIGTMADVAVTQPPGHMPTRWQPRVATVSISVLAPPPDEPSCDFTMPGVYVFIQRHDHGAMLTRHVFST